MKARAMVSFAVAAVLTVPLLLRVGEPGAPVWTAGVGGLGAGFLAVVPVLMVTSALEAVVLPALLVGVGGVLVLQGMPPWMAWPLVTGPLVGFGVSRWGSGRAEEGGEG